MSKSAAKPAVAKNIAVSEILGTATAAPVAAAPVAAAPVAAAPVAAAPAPSHKLRDATVVKGNLPKIENGALYCVSLSAFAGLNNVNGITSLKKGIVPNPIQNGGDFSDKGMQLSSAKVQRFHIPYIGAIDKEEFTPNHLIKPFYDSKTWYYVVTAPNPGSGFSAISRSVSEKVLLSGKNPYNCVFIVMEGQKIASADVFNVASDKGISQEFTIFYQALQFMSFVVASTINNPFKLSGYAGKFAKEIQYIRSELFGIITSIYFDSKDCKGSLDATLKVVSNWIAEGLPNEGETWDKMLGIYNFVGAYAGGKLESEGVSDSCIPLTLIEGALSSCSKWLDIPAIRVSRQTEKESATSGNKGNHRTNSRHRSGSKKPGNKVSVSW